MSIMQMSRSESEDEPLYWITKNGADLLRSLTQEGHDIKDVEADFDVEWSRDSVACILKKHIIGMSQEKDGR